MTCERTSPPPKPSNLEDFPESSDIVSFIREITDGLGADLVIECVGDPAVMSNGLDMLRIGGTYLIEGVYCESEDIKISLSKQILAKNARIIGISGMPQQAYGRVLKMMDSYQNMIPFEKIVTHRFDIEDAPAAMDVSISPNSGKVVLGSMK